QVDEVFGLPRDRTQVERARAGVVGDHVLQREAEPLVAGVEHVDRAEDDLGGGQHRGDRGGCLDVAREEERDLALDAGVDEAVEAHRIAEGGEHAAGDPPVQRRVDPHRLLLVAAREPELPADEPLARLQLGVDEEPLRLVGRGQVEVRVGVGELADGLAFPLRRDELLRDVGCLDHAASSELWRENRTVTGPRCANSARNTSPGATATMACGEPGRMMSPSRSPAPKAPSVLASHATQRAGLPSTAAPAPVCSTSPPRLTMTPTSRRSMWASGVMRPPVTINPDEALSATVSTSLIFQSATRLSTISIAGSTPAMAASAVPVVTPGPARSRPMTKAISASTRGCTSVARSTSSPSSTTIVSVSTPKSGSSTPSSFCMGFDVSPTFRPITRCPSATRRSMLIVWIA